MGVMRNILAAFLLCSPLAWAQFNGYVGLQTVYTPVLQNSSATGRTRVNANIGASYHTFTYCISSAVTAVQLIVEESPDGQDGHFTQLSPVSEFPTQAINGNECGVIRVGGYYSVLAVNVLILTGGTISVWYTATAGPTDLFPPAVNSSGGTSPVQCDQNVVVTDLPAGNTILIPANPLQGIYICGGTVSFAGTPPALSSVSLNFCTTAPNRQMPRTHELRAVHHRPGARLPLRPTIGDVFYFVYVTSSTPQIFPMNEIANSVLRIPPTASGTAICVSAPANTAVILNYAQF